jgi:hypothetical protein
MFFKNQKHPGSNINTNYVLRKINVIMNRKVKNTLLLVSCFVLPYQAVKAQQLLEKTSLRFYEHHSSTKTDAPFGEGANGDQSAYDFVGHKYLTSFDMGTYTAYGINSKIPESIDMVEHNGPYGNGGGIGFTSSESTIWAQTGPPYIRGNDQTLYMRAPSSFNYETATQMSDIKNAFNESNASKSVMAVSEGAVYLAKLRNAEKYIAIKVTGVKNMTGSEDYDDVYFNFNYKYAGTASGIKETDNLIELVIFPNPATSALQIQLQRPVSQATASIFNTSGQLQDIHYLNNTDRGKIDIQNLPNGIYYIQINDACNNTVSSLKFVKM